MESFNVHMRYFSLKLPLTFPFQLQINSKCSVVSCSICPARPSPRAIPTQVSQRFLRSVNFSYNLNNEPSKFEFLKHIYLYSFSGGLAVHKKGNSRQPTLSENVIKRKTCDDFFFLHFDFNRVRFSSALRSRTCHVIDFISRETMRAWCLKRLSC